MRKIKCKECNGKGEIGKISLTKDFSDIQCKACEGTGSISVYTIQELREGKVVAENDGLDIVMAMLLNKLKPMPDYRWSGNYKYLWFDDTGLCTASNKPKNISTQSVKIFLEEIEQEEKYPTSEQAFNELRQGFGHRFDKINIEETEFKWGEEVEWSQLGTSWWPAKYIAPMPGTFMHILENPERALYPEIDRIIVAQMIRKPQIPEITITLSQIAEKFNVKKELIKIVE